MWKRNANVTVKKWIYTNWEVSGFRYEGNRAPPSWQLIHWRKESKIITFFKESWVSIVCIKEVHKFININKNIEKQKLILYKSKEIICFQPSNGKFVILITKKMMRAF